MSASGEDPGATAESPQVAAADAALHNIGYEIFIALLSVLSIINFFLVLIIHDESLDRVLEIMNIPITIIFFIDFLFRFFTAPSKSQYFFRNWGWADLLASLPFQQTKVLRLFRLIKVYRLLKDYGGRNVVRALVKDKAGSALVLLLFVAILVLEFGSLWMLRIESEADGANITSASDAVWYTMVTISTVGYGDQYPVSNAGRVLGTIIIIVGVGIFGTLTGFLANLFLSPSKKKAAQADSLASTVSELRELVQRQQETLDTMEELLNRPSTGKDPS